MDWLIRLDCGAWRERRNKKTTSTTAIVNNESAMMNNAICVLLRGPMPATAALCATGGTDCGGGCGLLGVTVGSGAWGGGVSLTGSGFWRAIAGAGAG